MIKSKRIGWAGRVARVVEKRNKFIPVFGGKSWRDQTMLKTWAG
jgi:hypothetical protein